jgi:hypothetical protein
VDELVATIEPWEGILEAIKHWKQKLLSMLSDKCDHITRALFFLTTAIEDLFRLQMVDDDSELALVALDGGNNHRRLLRHGAQRQDLFFCGWWLHRRGGHGNENKGGMGGNLDGSNDDGGWL